MEKRRSSSEYLAEKKNMKKNKPLSEKEKKELEILDNPNIEFMSPSGGILPIIFGGDKLWNRKRKVVKLRLRLRGSMSDEEYQKAKREEEIRFNKRFKVEQCRKTFSNEPS